MGFEPEGGVMGRNITRQVLAEWNSNDHDTGDDLHLYFGETFGGWDWCEIYSEGLSVWELMFDEKIETFSPASGVFAAVAAQAAHGAFAAVAAALGVEPRELELATAEWYENQHDLPPPAGYDGLKEKVLEARQWLADLEKQHSHSFRAISEADS